MQKFLPLFPLKLVVFPGEHLNLHIFEPRYKELVKECEENDRTFGIPPYLDNKLMSFGTEIELLSIEKEYPGGELDIKTKGIGIFQTIDFFAKAENKLYAGGEVETLEIEYESDFSLTNEILEKVKELFQALKIKKSIPPNDPQFTTYKLAHHVGFSIDQEYEFLTIREELQRQEYMLRHLKNLIPVVKEMEALRKRVQMNGHFKNIQPPKL